jgi:hypothetical protein
MDQLHVHWQRTETGKQNLKKKDAIIGTAFGNSDYYPDTWSIKCIKQATMKIV